MAAADVECIGDVMSAVHNSTGATPTGSYAVFNDNTCSLMLLPSATATMNVTLRTAESDMVTVAPVLQVSVPTAANSASAAVGASVAFAPIGLINMLNPGGAIVSYSALSGPATAGDVAGPGLELVIKGHGSFLMYSSAVPAGVWLNGEPVEVQYDRFDGSVLVQIPAYTGSLVNTLVVKL